MELQRNPLFTKKKPQQSNTMTLTQEDWDIILKAAKCLSFKKGEIVLREGEPTQKIYQLTRGVCNVEKSIRNRSTKLAQLHPNDIFGDISFVKETPASATIVAETDDVEVHTIDAYVLKITFEQFPNLAAKFYYYLGKIMANRLYDRERHKFQKFIKAQEKISNQIRGQHVSAVLTTQSQPFKKPTALIQR
jgi:CRP-like cAMP-binding protein